MNALQKSNIMAVVAILALTSLEAIALWKGTDGSFFGVIIASIAGLGGYQIGLNTPTPPTPPQQ